MARSTVCLCTALLQLMVLGPLLLKAFAGAASIELPSKPHLKYRSPGPAAEPANAPAHSSVRHFFVSGDGSKIVQIDSPNPDPGTLATLATNGGHSYTFSITDHHGDPSHRPAFAKYLFDCEFGLFGQVPASGKGVWEPYPRGRYVCNLPQLPGMLRVALVENTIDYKMAYHDLAFVIKVLHDEEAVKDETFFFDFEFNYTPDTTTTPKLQKVMGGQWVRSRPNDASMVIN